MLSAKQIAPGQTGQIEVNVKTEGAEGALSKSVTVTTNDPRQPQVILSVTATVQPEFELSERAIFFGNVPKGKEVTKELIITIPSDDVKLTGAESTDQNLAVRLEPVAGSNGKKVKLIATLKADAKEGYHTGSIVIKTSSARTPELRLVVRAMVSASQHE